MGFFESLRPHHNFVVIVLMIMKFGTSIKLEVAYTMVRKTFVTSPLLRNYDTIACILADASSGLVTPKPFRLI